MSRPLVLGLQRHGRILWVLGHSSLPAPCLLGVPYRLMPLPCPLLAPLPAPLTPRSRGRQSSGTTDRAGQTGSWADSRERITSQSRILWLLYLQWNSHLTNLHLTFQHCHDEDWTLDVVWWWPWQQQCGGVLTRRHCRRLNRLVVSLPPSSLPPHHEESTPPHSHCLPHTKLLLSEYCGEKMFNWYNARFYFQFKNRSIFCRSRKISESGLAVWEVSDPPLAPAAVMKSWTSRNRNIQTTEFIHFNTISN